MNKIQNNETFYAKVKYVIIFLSISVFAVNKNIPVFRDKKFEPELVFFPFALF